MTDQDKTIIKNYMDLHAKIKKIKKLQKELQDMQPEVARVLQDQYYIQYKGSIIGCSYKTRLHDYFISVIPPEEIKRRGWDKLNFDTIK